MPLTDMKIRALKPEPKTRKYADGGNMYLEVKPNGSKLWKMAYSFDGKQKTLSFGPYRASRIGCFHGKARAYHISRPCSRMTMLTLGCSPLGARVPGHCSQLGASCTIRGRMFLSSTRLRGSSKRAKSSPHGFADPTTSLALWNQPSSENGWTPTRTLRRSWKDTLLHTKLGFQLSPVWHAGSTSA
ncbi:phage integrase family site specific recombinase [Hyphomonas polymorpha PS728]|uniref:Phage integrase family site specific recombinase n=1 Tax=Hyphomonas polymorpha PS728 TaxID=1280954 RepID=A0A062VGC2_9PROT|nr:phage integrase family site specific recombinase [Hyphomonas polymorpha PS728]